MKLLKDVYCLVDDLRIISNFDYSEELENVWFSVVIDDQGVQNRTSIYQKISDNNGGKQFCLALNLDCDTVTEALLQDICSFFFLLNYQHISAKPVVVLPGEEEVNNSLLSEKLNDVMKRQGLKEALYLNVQDELNLYSTFTDGDKENFRQLLKHKYSAPINLIHKGIIFVHIKDSSAISDVVSACSEAELNLKETQPELYYLLEENKALADNVHQLEDSVSFMQERLTHQNDYLAFIRSNNEAKEIQAFYNKQYEVLPLWYKRFGHVLKFLMRK
ncbi:MAG: hypothetical protein AB1632_04940 [Nitrospirota bacterium]